MAQIVARFDPWATLADGNSLGDPLISSLEEAVRREVHGRDPAARVPPVSRFVFSQDSKQALVDRLNLRLAARALTYPPHKALLTELRSFEYGPTGSTASRGPARGPARTTTACARWRWPSTPRRTRPPPRRPRPSCSAPCSEEGGGEAGAGASYRGTPLHDIWGRHAGYSTTTRTGALATSVALAQDPVKDTRRAARMA